MEEGKLMGVRGIEELGVYREGWESFMGGRRGRRAPSGEQR
jgi:hypothetical protein